MRVSLVATLDAEQRLCIQFYGESIPIETPFSGEVVGSDDVADTSQIPRRISWGMIRYPLPEHLLPPLLLIEQIPVAARTHQGGDDLHFIGQSILAADELGEPVMIRFSPGAYRLWCELEQRSLLHQQARQHRTQAIDALFVLSLADLPEALHEQQQRAAHYVSPLVVAAGQQEGEVRRLLHHLSQVRPHWRPLPWLFGLLRHRAHDIQRDATALLLPLAHLLPFERLDAIVLRAELPARLCALHIIAHSGHERAATILLAERTQAHPAIRRTALDGLMVVCSPDDVDLLAALETGVHDVSPLVRLAAAWHLFDLGVRAPAVMMHLSLLAQRAQEEEEGLIRFVLHLILLRRVRWLPAVELGNESL